MKLKKFNYMYLTFVIIFYLFALSGCETSSTKIEEIKDQAYREGYEAGYYCGAKDQYEKDCDEFLIDSYSVRDVEKRVYDEFGMTPSEAFTVFDEYEYDSNHGGYSYAEYKNAIEAMYFTASVFPFDY